MLALAPCVRAQVVTGNYTGDGTAGRMVNGLGFQPELVIIKLNDIGISGVARTSTMAGGTKAVWGNTGLLGNQVTSLDADGFTVGNDIAVNALNACGGVSAPCEYYWTAFNAGSNIFVGSYTGDGAGTQAIAGVGFAVDYVMIFGEGVRWARNRWTFASTTPLGAGANFRIRNSGENATSIPSLDVDGFTVGDGVTGQDDANENGVTYHYAAFNERAGAIKMGMYPGDGGNPRDVTGVGFQPIYLMVQSLDDGDQAYQKSDKMPATDSFDFINDLLNTRIVGLIADGFQVTNDTRVNAGGEDYTYVAFSGTAGAAKPVYYSVGTSGADFKNGSPTVTLSSGTATFTTPQPVNVGLGDEITYNGATKAYISGRTSAYVYTVTTARGLVPADIAGATVNSLKRAFNSLSAAQTGSSDGTHLTTADLVTENVQLNWACYNDNPMNDTLDVTGWTTSAANHIRIFTPTTPNEVGLTQRHYGVQGTGFRLTPVDATAQGYNVIYLRTGYVRIEGIEIDGSGFTNAWYVRGITVLRDLSNVGDIRIDSMIIHDLHTTAGAVATEATMGILDYHDDAGEGPPLRVSNNIIYDITSTLDVGHIGGMHIGARGTSYVYNNTVYKILNNPSCGSPPCGPSWGIYTKAWGGGSVTVIATNNYVGDVQGQNPNVWCYDTESGGVLIQSNNVASDLTAAGAGSVDSQFDYVNYFVSITPGSENLHLLSDTPTLWGTNGADLDGDPNLPVTVDIDGEPRPSSAPDIGADEAVVTTNYRSIGTAPNYLTGTIDTTAGSPVVTGTTTAWVTVNRGRGDHLAFNLEEYTVLSVDSETQITLTTPVVSTFTGGYTLHRQFTTLQGWEDCISGAGGCTYFPVATGDLVLEGRREVGIAYDDSVVPADPDFTDGLRINGATTDATHNIVLTADGANRHYGIPGAGVLNDCSACANADDELQVFTDNVTIEWLEIVGHAGTGSDGGIKVRAGMNQLLQFLLVHDNQNGIRLSDLPGKALTIRNSIIYNNTDNGIEGDELGDVLVVENCTVFGHGQAGIHGKLGPATATVRNTISMNNVGSDFTSIGAQENNISEDATASCGSCLPNRDVTANASPPAPPQGNGWVMFLNLNPANENFHLRNNLALNDAQDNAQDLSASFIRDIDSDLRAVSWDVGADDADATTAVELIAFDAAGLDGSVELSWETGSELGNLGFHLYRSMAPDGELERITNEVIPGLGSSPAGAHYRYRDAGLANDVTYYYELEDIDTNGATEMHGPISAVPRAGAGEIFSDERLPGEDEPSARSMVTFGDPSANRFEVLSWDEHGALVELRTEGFYAQPADDDSVIITAPGLEPLGGEGALALAVGRPWIEAVACVGVKVVGIETSDVEVFSSLRPLDPETFDLAATSGGVVRVERKRRSSPRRGATPRRAARILETAFQGEAKKAHLELAPLRWNANRSELRLTRRLVVRVSFSGRANDELAGIAKYRPRKREKVIARFATTSSGLHVVHYQEILGTIRRGYDVHTLGLSRLGQSVPFHVEPDPRRMEPGSTLYFLSAGPDANPYGIEAVYELEWSETGVTMTTASASPSGASAPYYWRTLVQERDQYYQPALLRAPDRWLWDVLLSTNAKSYPVEIDALAPSIDNGRLSVWLQGGSDLEATPDHHVRVFVNGMGVGDVSWDGKTPYRVDAELPPGTLVVGANTIEIENVGDTDAAYSMVFLDRFELDYPRPVASASGRLDGGFSSSGTATVLGLRPDARVVDVTDENAPVWLDGLGESQEGGLAFRVEPDRHYTAVSPESIRNPEVRRAARARLRNRRRGADYVLVGPEAFLEAAGPLVELRRAEGLRVRAVSFEQITEEFGYGEARPEAIHDFLEFAFHEWRAPALKYVLLLGDATYDFKDAMGTGVVNQIPPLMVETSYLWTASDPTLAMIDGDDMLPDVAIGRLPASDIDELRTMIGKILDFELGDATFQSHPMVLVADDPDLAGDFVASADEIAASVLPRERVEKIYLSQLGRSATREAIVRSFDDGAALVSYIGHGGINLWADENIFNLGDVATLASQSQQPMFITMNCLNGYFHFPFFDSLAEGLLKAEGKGAIAAFSPSGLSLNTPAHRFHKALLDALVHQGHERLGDAVLAAQATYAESGAFPELLAIYHLLGDPALRLK